MTVLEGQRAASARERKDLLQRWAIACVSETPTSRTLRGRQKGQTDRQRMRPWPCLPQGNIHGVIVSALETAETWVRWGRDRAVSGEGTVVCNLLWTLVCCCCLLIILSLFFLFQSANFGIRSCWTALWVDTEWKPRSASERDLGFNGMSHCCNVTT